MDKIKDLKSKNKTAALLAIFLFIAFIMQLSFLAIYIKNNKPIELIIIGFVGVAYFLTEYIFQRVNIINIDKEIERETNKIFSK